MRNCVLLLILGCLLGVHTVQAYYSPEQGRWLTRDPIGEHKFLTDFTKEKSEKDKIHFNKVSREPAYLFVYNNPIRNFDYLGLDRWIGDELHTYIIVEQWSADGSTVVGYNRIDFASNRAFL
ncbi:MAG: hypothetical protein M0P27_00595 [Bacteroidales bacterium]|nr:hypothetical protein [Bacteroidales bacterium]